MAGKLDVPPEHCVYVHVPNKECNPIKIAINAGNVECVIKLIKNGAQLNCPDDKTDYGMPVWAMAAQMRSVEILKCMIAHGLDKDITDQRGTSLLLHVIYRGSVEAVRYLLELGVTVNKSTPDYKFEVCQGCEKNRLLNLVDTESRQLDPCMKAILYDCPEKLQLLEEYGCKSSKCFQALIDAVGFCSLDCVEYLLSKYTYPLNDKYMTDNSNGTCEILLRDSSSRYEFGITKLLLDHGADPNTKICNGEGYTALVHAIFFSHQVEEIIPLYIRSGVYINLRSHHNGMGKILPFEAAILNDCLFVAEMLLVCGCSCGVYSLGNSDMDNIRSDLKDLMEKWHVQENNVVPLEQQCRRMLLNHLSPQADRKTMKLPLPSSLITYLSIPELDDILVACRESTRHLYM